MLAPCIKYRVSQKKAPTCENSPRLLLPLVILHQDYCKDLNHSNSSQKLKDQSIFVISLAVLPALEVLVNSTLYKFHGCQMTEKGRKTLIKSYGLYSSRTIGHWRFTSLKSYKTSIFNQIRKIFSPKAIHAWSISLTHEKLHFLHY